MIYKCIMLYIEYKMSIRIIEMYKYIYIVLSGHMINSYWSSDGTNERTIT